MSRIASNTNKKSTVRFIDPDEAEEEEFTIDCPDWLPRNFTPIRPVSIEEALDFELKDKEPYVGYAVELQFWEREWSKASELQSYVDGYYSMEPEPFHPLEWYVAFFRDTYLRENLAIDGEIALRGGSELTAREYAKLFDEIAERRENERLSDCVARREVFGCPWIYSELIRGGYVEELGEQGFRFLKRTKDMKFIESDGPYTDVIDEIREFVDRCDAQQG